MTPTRTPAPSRVEARHEQTRQQVLDAAWRLAAEQGLTGLSLRDLAAAVGMRAPSLYSYFPSKAAILDAMFAQGYRDLDAALFARRTSLPPGTGEADALVLLVERWIAFCQEHPARYQLMFTAAVPGWQPSADAYAASLASYDVMAVHLAGLGVTDQGHLDLFTALTSGLVAQQMANDPAGDRWRARTGDAVAMFLAHVRHPQTRKERP
jgi:AcrR family transcriptional regulator